MNSYRYLIVLVCFIVATFQSEITNVGTVLFSSSDIRKKQWNPMEIGLLHARRHFQTLIPHPHLINTDEDFIKSMLTYFKECYSSVKREAKDTETDTIMNAALSDAIGGFLKVWLLPTAKFAYYGGTVSLVDTKKVFQFYDEIKTCLKTDGSSWHSPDLNFLNTLAMTVTPQWFPMTRGVENKCNQLAYYEKTDSGLTIPVPNVNWDNETASMFVPLKNQSLIPLHSSTNSLFKYYDAATNCMEASKLDEQFKFKNRFQDWLTKEVVPHLNDDVLYPAFGNVLSLVDRLKNLADSSLPEARDKSYFVMPSFIASKKMMIIYLIVALEVICCIPTLCYLVWIKIRRQKCKNVYLYIEKGRKTKKPQISNTDQCTSKPKVNSRPVIDLRINHSQTQERNLKPKLQDKDCVLENPYLSTSSKQLQGSMVYISTEIVDDKANVIYERPKWPKKKSSKKVTNYNNTQKSSETVTQNVRRVQLVPDESDSISTIQLGRSNTVTIVNEQRIGNKREANRHLSGKHKLEYSVSASPVKMTPEPHDKETHNVESFFSIKTSATNPPSVKSLRKQIKSRQDTNAVSVTNFSNQQSRMASRQNVIEQSKRRLIKTSSGSPDIEITIDCQSLQAKVKAGDSKIPKRTFKIDDGSQAATASNPSSYKEESQRKSLIPLPRRQKTEDIVIKKKYKPNQSKLLNKTF